MGTAERLDALRKIGSRLLKSLAVFLALLFLTWLALRLAAGSMERSVLEEYSAAGIDMANYVSTLPDSENNETTKLLVALAASAGVNIKATSGDGTELPAKRLGEQLQGTRFGEYLAGELRKPERNADPPGPELAEYLEKNAGALEETTALLLGEEPRFYSRPGLLYMNPLPDHFGYMELSRLLLARSLYLHGLGRETEALDQVKAVWMLSNSLRRNPPLISSLLAFSMRSNCAATLRKLSPPPGPDLSFMDADGEDPLCFKAQLLEHALFHRLLKEPLSMNPNSRLTWSERVSYPFQREYLRLCSADSLKAALPYLTLLRDKGATISNGDLLKANETHYGSLSSWNIIGRISVSQVSDPNLRAKYSILQCELTREVLRRRDAGTGVGVPPAADSIVRSRFPDCSWKFSPGKEGGFSLDFQGPDSKEFGVRSNSDLPLSYRE